MATTSAEDMAKQAGIDPKRFRKALRDERFSWHNHNDRWTVGRQHTGLGDTLKYPRPIESAATLAYGVCCDHAFHDREQEGGPRRDVSAP